ncbi:hypothetical protein GGH95_004494 [Coemansia sp. RSA 1836]|nr:hypothetical protein GGH95_004494 [Coemansia sp. RSA 1836]
MGVCTTSWPPTTTNWPPTATSCLLPTSIGLSMLYTIPRSSHEFSSARRDDPLL